MTENTRRFIEEADVKRGTTVDRLRRGWSIYAVTTDEQVFEDVLIASGAHPGVVVDRESSLYMGSLVFKPGIHSFKQLGPVEDGRSWVLIDEEGTDNV